MSEEDPKSDEPDSIERAMREVAEIVAAIESGELGLEEGLAKYERGNELIRRCSAAIQRAEKRIDEISRGEHPGDRG